MCQLLQETVAREQKQSKRPLARKGKVDRRPACGDSRALTYLGLAHSRHTCTGFEGSSPPRRPPTTTRDPHHSSWALGAHRRRHNLLHGRDLHSKAALPRLFRDSFANPRAASPERAAHACSAPSQRERRAQHAMPSQHAVSTISWPPGPVYCAHQSTDSCILCPCLPLACLLPASCLSLACLLLSPPPLSPARRIP